MIAGSGFPLSPLTGKSHRTLLSIAQSRTSCNSLIKIAAAPQEAEIDQHARAADGRNQTAHAGSAHFSQTIHLLYSKLDSLSASVRLKHGGSAAVCNDIHTGSFTWSKRYNEQTHQCDHCLMRPSSSNGGCHPMRSRTRTKRGPRSRMRWWTRSCRGCGSMKSAIQSRGASLCMLRAGCFREPKLRWQRLLDSELHRS